MILYLLAGNSSSTSSPGPSGLSYSLIKAYPEPTKKYLYGLLCAFWTDHSIPEFWKSSPRIQVAPPRLINFNRWV